MKSFRTLTLALALATSTLLSFSLSAHADTKEKDKAKPKPYPLKTCLVSDEKLDEDPNMKSHSCTYEGQEIKLCCKSCLKDFNKDPKTYLKKLKDKKK